MCKGTVREKAELFFKILIGMENERMGYNNIAWSDRRLKIAF